MDSYSLKRQPRRAWNTPWNIRKTEHARRKPDGGFCFIPAMAFIRAWWAYKGAIIRLYDLRVWFACFEAVARRCDVAPDRFPRYTFEEIFRLVGGADPGAIQTAVGRLSKAGLLEWSERQIRLPAAMSRVENGRDPDLGQMIELVVNHRRKVPVPRRTLRFLAGVSRPVMTATVLGHLFRCVYYRNGMCIPVGRCKASWIAETFGVDVRNVKAARRHLSDIGWLVVEDSPQMAMNRWGASVTIQLAWEFRLQERSKSPPPQPISPAESPPPEIHRKLSTRMINQKPHAGDGPGVCQEPPPNLNHIQAIDLHDANRLECLFVQAQRYGLSPGGEAARLRFFAAAARALRVGTRNPPGLFASIVRRGLWAHLCMEDEDLACRRMAGMQAPFRTTQQSEDRPPRAGAIAPVPAHVILDSVLKELGVGRGLPGPAGQIADKKLLSV